MKYLICIFLTSLSFSLSAQSNRPQEPMPPFDYVTEEVTFTNEKDDLTLACTLTYPKEGSHFPAVILISGSGPQDRNSELMGHKPFLVIADHLTKQGIAVLRVDDRGAGASEGDYNAAGLDQFVEDNVRALEYLKSRKEVDSKQIGIIGHSLGGVIAPIIAAQHDDVAFTVLLAGSGIRGDKLMLLQKEKIERSMGMPEMAIAQSREAIKGAYELLLASDTKDMDALRTQLQDYFETTYGDAMPKIQVEMISKQLTVPWLVDFIRFDPKTSLSKTTCPVLALIGSNDLQVPPKENLEAIQQILTDGGNKDVECMELEGMNHLFQESETGLPAEYATIEQTIAPVALDIMTKWILTRVK